MEDSVLNIFTDGSKDGSDSGFGWCIATNDHVITDFSQSLEPTSSPYMAELVALSSCLGHLLEWDLDPTWSTIIWTDSLSAVEALKAPIINHPLVKEVHDLLVKVGALIPLNLRWIRGHNNSTGNEYADFLAKKAD